MPVIIKISYYFQVFVIPRKCVKRFSQQCWVVYVWVCWCDNWVVVLIAKQCKTVRSRFHIGNGFNNWTDFPVNGWNAYAFSVIIYTRSSCYHKRVASFFFIIWQRPSNIVFICYIRKNLFVPVFVEIVIFFCFELFIRNNFVVFVPVNIYAVQAFLRVNDIRFKPYTAAKRAGIIFKNVYCCKQSHIFVFVYMVKHFSLQGKIFCVVFNTDNIFINLFGKIWYMKRKSF